MKILGIILILLSIALIATGGFNFRTQEKIIDTDKIDISRTETKTVTWSLYAGGITIVDGLAILVTDSRIKLN